MSQFIWGRMRSKQTIIMQWAKGYDTVKERMPSEPWKGICQSTQTAVNKILQTGWIKQQKLSFSQLQRLENPRSSFWQGSDSLPDLLTAAFSPCPNMVERERERPLVFLPLLISTTILLNQGLTPMTLLPPLNPISKYSPIARQGFNKTILRGQNSDHSKASKAKGG